jgi:hypothetical protein
MPNEEQNQPLQQPLVSGSLLEEIRQAFADYYASEGCSCCQDIEPHEKASLRLGELLGAKMYEDGSGVDWYAYRSKQ